MYQAEAVLFNALGDPTRLQLLNVLSHGEPLSISKLTRVTDISRQGVTKHLNVLHTADLVSSEQVGREKKFRLNTAGFQSAQSYLNDICAHWDISLSRLQALVTDNSV